MPDAAARALLASAARRTIALPENGVEIALLDWGGEGPVALLHHANGFCKGVWGLVAEALRDRYRVIVRLDSGGTLAMNEVGEGELRVGDRVRIVSQRVYRS